MHIISKHRDYYDSIISSVGIDKTCRYMRDMQYVKYDFKDIARINGWRANYHLPAFDIDKSHRTYNKPKGKPDYYNYFIIGFCGKLYIGYYFKWKGDFEQYFKPNGTEDVEIITYDFDKMIELTGEYKNPDANTKKQLADFKNSWDAIHNTKAIDVFRELNTPVFIYNTNKVLINHTIEELKEFRDTQINPILKTYQFAKVFEPYLAFQEISMFIGGVLGNNENNMIEISDADRMASRGLDKTSFRQDAPGQKKENRRLNKERKKIKVI